MYPSDHEREGIVPRKQGNDMTDETHNWDINWFDTLAQFLLIPVALSSIFLLFAIAVGPASAKPKSLKLHFTLNQVEAGCINGNGTFSAAAGPGSYGCTGAGGNLSCTAKGHCTFTPKLHGNKIARNATIENLIRS
jgi:hypothetical protein